MFGSTNFVGITVLGSGSKGNATLIHNGKNAILVDCGFSFREFNRRCLLAQLPKDLTIKAVLVTHEHTDHVNGLRTLSNKLDIPIFTTSACCNALRAKFHIDQRFNLIASGSPFSLLGFEITPFSIPHDAVDPVGFVFHFKDKKFAVGTDIGNANTLVTYALKGCDALVLESNHDLNMLAASPRPWSVKQRIMGNMGHLSNEATCDLLTRIVQPNLKHLILAHLSSECNTPELARLLATQCLQEQLHRTDIHLDVAAQDHPIQTCWF